MKKDAQPAPTPHLLRSGVPAHVLTTEERRKGAETLNARRRAAAAEARKTQLERIADDLRADHERAMSPYWRAIDDGDWRASEALFDRVHGRPTARLEVQADTERQAPEDAYQRMMELREQLKALEP